MNSWFKFGTLLFCLLALPMLAETFSGAQRETAMHFLRDANQRMVRAGLMEREGDTLEALALYRDALESYQKIHERYEDVRTGFVRFRIDHCQRRIEELSTAPPPVSPETREAVEPVSLPEDEKPARPEDPNGSAALGTSPVGSSPDAVGRGANETENRAPPVEEEDKEAPGMDIEKVGLQLRIFRARRQLSLAEDVLSEALKVYPDNRKLILWMAGLKLEMGAFDEAAETLEMMGDDSSDEAVLLLAAAVAVGRGNHFEALRMLDEALKLNPRSAQAYMNLAILRYRMNPAKNREEAATYYRQALRLGASADREFERELQ